MAIAEAILVCLTDRSMSGYDLAKNFDASIGFFWRASHQQIYRELGRLRDKGYVVSEEITQDGKPNRIIHTITPAGKKALKVWSTKPVRLPSIKDDLFVKFYAMEDIDLEAFKDQITIRAEQHQSKLARYNRIKERYYDGQKLNRKQQGKLIALQMGIMQEINNIENLKHAMSEVVRLSK